MDRLFTIVASRTAFAAGQPAAFVAAVLIIAGWGISGPLFGWSDTWQLVVNTATTIATFLMVFLIQNSQNRDAAAMQAKLDELIRAVHNARNDFVGIEHLTDREIEEIRSVLEDSIGSDHARHGQRKSLERLLKRR